MLEMIPYLISQLTKQSDYHELECQASHGKGFSLFTLLQVNLMHCHGK